jgi:hypothetical protein
LPWYSLVGEVREIETIERQDASGDDTTLCREFGSTAGAVADAARVDRQGHVILERGKDLSRGWKGEKHAHEQRASARA